MTLEGCVVRISDVMAYIGRDVEDAITLKLIERKDIPDIVKKVLGDRNNKIINTLVLDLISNSYDKPYLEFSENVFNALEELKKFNDEKIYNNPKIKTQKEKIIQTFRLLFNKYLDDFRKRKCKSGVFLKSFLKYMPKEYLDDTPPERMVIDYIAGMTNDFFNNQFKEYFVPQSYGYSIKKEKDSMQ